MDALIRIEGVCVRDDGDDFFGQTRQGETLGEDEEVSAGPGLKFGTPRAVAAN
jgi:hypothetical protein